MSRYVSSRLLVLSALALASTLPLAAQYQQPGSKIEISQGRRQQIEEAVEDARWNLGSFRIQPWVGLNDVAYQDPVQTPEGPTDDIHITAGAGLKFYLPVGSDTFVVAHALPEYSYWLDVDDRNQLIGQYGLGVFAFLNRLEFELTGRQIEEIAFLSSEVLQDLPQTREVFQAKAQLRIAGSIAVALSGTQNSFDAENYDDTPFSPVGSSDPGLFLDREETQLRAGFRYLLRANGGYFGVGVQDEETRFDLATGRDNDGTAVYAEALLRGNKMDIAFDIVQRELEGSVDGSFPGYDETDGRLLIALHPRATSDLQFYANRELAYSALDGATYFEAETYGVAARLDLSHQSSISGYYETGHNNYFDQGATSPFPDEDTSAWGADLSYQLGRSLNLRFGYGIAEYDSPDDSRDREVERITLGLSIGSNRPGEW